MIERKSAAYPLLYIDLLQRGFLGNCDGQDARMTSDSAMCEIACLIPAARLPRRLACCGMLRITGPRLVLIASDSLVDYKLGANVGNAWPIKIGIDT